MRLISERLFHRDSQPSPHSPSEPCGISQPLSPNKKPPGQQPGYLQLVGMRGERLHLAERPRAAQRQGEAGELPGGAADVQALQGVQVELPDAQWCSQPGVPAAVTTDQGSEVRATKQWD